MARSDPAAIEPGSPAAWRVAARPQSLPVALSPVLVGGALAWQRGAALDAGVAALVLAVALLMQVIVNLQNDVGYAVRRADAGPGPRRVGLPRATTQGWLRPAAVRVAIALLALLATLVGLWLAARRGWPVLAMGGASLAAALAYMGGPRPIAYTPLGELTVFVFFGLVAVCGTDWMLSGHVGAATAVAAAAIGCLAAAALVVNNQRDRDHDAGVGRRTFAVVFGAAAGQRLFAVLLALPMALVPVVAGLADGPAAGRLALLLPLLLAPAARRLWRDFRDCPPGPGFNALLLRSFRLELQFAALLAAGAIVAGA